MTSGKFGHKGIEDSARTKCSDCVGADLGNNRGLSLRRKDLHTNY